MNDSKHNNIKIWANQIINNVRIKVLHLIAVNLLSQKNFKSCNRLARYFGININVANVTKVARIMNWLKPVTPYIKLNTDGSVGKTASGMGGIIRNSIGNPIATFAGPLSTKSVLTAELLGISQGLKICLELGIQNVHIEVDSKLAIQAISATNVVYPNEFYIIRRIKLLLSSFNFTISYIYREGNACAD
ncbi:uncharacterized protein LOC110095865 [Dendrobium catenatum]|uniref:uncharacterized protein LOC110095865 n=1 Tax=Dendrobium catenatum TaxID=906689 RepID=UPI0009F61A7D|nr:uncharacterized protein LOC110095865 [Dendrobium catenatum]